MFQINNASILQKIADADRCDQNGESRRADEAAYKQNDSMPTPSRVHITHRGGVCRQTAADSDSL